MAQLEKGKQGPQQSPLTAQTPEALAATEAGRFTSSGPGLGSHGVPDPYVALEKSPAHIIPSSIQVPAVQHHFETPPTQKPEKQPSTYRQKSG